jgi:ABC-type dipeptide/oligopeptide/nickel transport system permease component
VYARAQRATAKVEDAVLRQQAVRAQDYPLLNALFLVITLAVLGANALVDVLTTLLDPRTRSPGDA